MLYYICIGNQISKNHKKVKKPELIHKKLLYLLTFLKIELKNVNINTETEKGLSFRKTNLLRTTKEKKENLPQNLPYSRSSKGAALT